MSTESSEASTASFLTRAISRRHSLWTLLGIGIPLVLLPLGAAALDGILADVIGQGFWRAALLPAAVVLYILIVAPILDRQSARVIEAFRPVVLMDDDEFDALVDQASRLSPIGEIAAFGVGAAFGLWVGYVGLTDDVFWLRLCLSLMSGLMFGLLAWTIYAAVAGTRLTSQLHRLPLRIDLFDISPFEPIGRQSLSVALVFVGGILLSVLFGLGQVNIFVWPNWFLYILLTSVPVVLFFLNMRDTHRVLAAEKKRQIEAVQGHIIQASRELMERLSLGEAGGTLASEINALAEYEDRLQATRTWPYDTVMLRTLFFSLIIPAGAELVKLASQRLF